MFVNGVLSLLTCRASVTTFTRSNQGFGEEEGLATGGVPMQGGMDEGARMDHGGGRQHGEMLGAAGVLHRPEEEGLSPQVGGAMINMGGVNSYVSYVYKGA